jgi:trimeric autotransporter adhesin
MYQHAPTVPTIAVGECILTTKPSKMKTPALYWALRQAALTLLFPCMLVPLAGAQEVASREDIQMILLHPTMKNTKTEKTTNLSRITPGDAIIHGLTVGRGSGTNAANSAFGISSLAGNVSGVVNAGFGFQALMENTTGSYNTAFGAYALEANTEGTHNTGLGAWTLYKNTTGTNNVAIGSGSLYLNTTGAANVAIGGGVMMGNTTGDRNLGIGINALLGNKTGSFNIALGPFAMRENVAGQSNIAIGTRALFNSTEIDDLVAIGDSALYHNGLDYSLEFHGIENTAIGKKSLYSNTTGGGNTAIGYNSMEENVAASLNTAVGAWALRENISGGFNTAVGYDAGAWRESVSQGTFIGYSAFALNDGLTNVTAIGHDSRPTKDNQVVIGNTFVTEIGGAVDWSVISDGNYKMNVEDGVAGLDFIMRLRPVTYNLDANKLASELNRSQKADGGQGGLSNEWSRPGPGRTDRSFENDEADRKSNNEKSRITYTGFVAQEVEEAARLSGYDFSGVSVPQNESEYYTLRYGSFTVPLVKAVQELNHRVEELQPEGYRVLQETISEQQTRIEQLEAANRELHDRLDDILAILGDMGADFQDCCGPNETGFGGTGLPGNEQPSGEIPGPGFNAGGSARLEQNAPNPFSEHTWIRYHLPEGAANARIILTDLAGNRVMSYDLPGDGAGQLMISGGALRSGTYIYTLLVNGEVKDSKRLVLLQ